MKLSRLARPWARAFQRSLKAALKPARKSSAKAAPKAAASRTRRPAVRATASGLGSWLPGLAVGAGGSRRYRLFKPPGTTPGQPLPLLVMLHGCGQDAQAFADSTRMNVLARQQGFLVLYPEQDRLANAQGCWNWFDTRSGRAYQEAASILAAIDQVCLLHGADRGRVAVAGLSAGASMAALLAARHPERFRAVAMHSGVPAGSAYSALTALSAMRGRRPAPALTVPAGAAGRASLPPLLVIQGLADKVVAPVNGAAAVQCWADACQALPQPRRYVQRGKRYPVAITEFRQARALRATLMEVAALGHAWSGGAPGKPYGDIGGPDASRMIWAFVRKALAARGSSAA